MSKKLNETGSQKNQGLRLGPIFAIASEGAFNLVILIKKNGVLNLL